MELLLISFMLSIYMYSILIYYIQLSDEFKNHTPETLYEYLVFIFYFMSGLIPVFNTIISINILKEIKNK